MELFRIIKKDARRALHSFAGRATASVLIIAMAYLAVTITHSALLFIFSGAESLQYDFFSIAECSAEILAVTGGMSLLYFLIMPALFLGYTKLHFAFAEGKDESINTLFDMFSSPKKFFGSFLFGICCAVLGILSFAAGTAPGAALFYCAYNFIPESTATLSILRIGALCICTSVIILGAVFTLVFIRRWHLAPYYFVTGSGIFRSFRQSAKATAGIHGDILRFRLSFIGWALLSFFILPMLYSIPYFFIASAIHAKYLMEKYEHSLAVVPENFEHGEAESEITEEKDSPQER